MMKILMNLQPRKEPAGEVLFYENEEVNELIFICQGAIDVGLTYNKEVKYVLRFIDKIMVAGYNCTFNCRTYANYRCKTDSTGYSMPQDKW